MFLGRRGDVSWVWIVGGRRERVFRCRVREGFLEEVAFELFSERQLFILFDSSVSCDIFG